MVALVDGLAASLLVAVRDVLPIVAVIFVFQYLVLRRPLAHPWRTLKGVAYVVVGLALLLYGLEHALFPIGRLMGEQLAAAAVGGGINAWHEFRWVLLYAAALGFAAAIAEPLLLVLSHQANRVSGGAIGVLGLRIAVALGTALGAALGTLRLVTGLPLHYLVFGLFVVVMVQTRFAPRAIVPLAYDSGVVATSIVMVPLLAALGLGLAAVLPGASVLDGFGVIIITSLTPIIMVMGYAQLAARIRPRGA